MPVVPRAFVVSLLVAIFFFFAAAAATTTATTATTAIPGSSSAAPVLNYTSSTPCEPPIGELLGELYTQNRDVYEQCQQETPDKYMLLPFSGSLPSDAQLLAMASSKSCLYFYQAVLLLRGMNECVLGGIGVKSAAETLLMTSQDPLRTFAVLSASEFAEFLTWRHERNVAQQNQQKFDARSRSAQLRDALARFELTIMENLRIQLTGVVIGTQASGGGGGNENNAGPESRPAASTGASTKDTIIQQFQLSSDGTSAATGQRNSAARLSTLGFLVSVFAVAALWLSL